MKRSEGVVAVPPTDDVGERGDLRVIRCLPIPQADLLGRDVEGDNSKFPPSKFATEHKAKLISVALEESNKSAQNSGLEVDYVRDVNLLKFWSLNALNGREGKRRPCPLLTPPKKIKNFV